MQSLRTPGGEPGLFILPETCRCPSVTASSIPLKDLAAVSRFLRLRSKLAQYGAARSHTELSRHRNAGVVGGGVNKATRYLLLSGHYEADISSAFHTIISSFAADLGSLINAPPTSALGFIRNHLSPSPGTDEVPKLILQRIITAGPETIATQIWDRFRIGIDHILIAEIRHFYDFLRPRIAKRMRDA